MRSHFVFAGCMALVACAGIAGATLFDRVLLTEYVQSTGAMCLDGTPAAYYINRGSSNNWVIFLQGGGWSYNETESLQRAGGDLGSSKNYPASWTPDEGTNGIMSNSTELNPDFADWNRVYVRYCDGASYAGNVDGAVSVDGHDIYFRGIHNFNAVVDHLLKNGMDGAEKAILSGCSAGGLATYIHCDHFADIVKEHGIETKCLADAGFFVDVPSAGSPSGSEMVIREDYTYVFNMQNCTEGVNRDCIERTKESERWKCFFPQYTLPHLRTPMFVLNSGYDSWQTSNIWFADGPWGGQPPAEWANCANEWKCTAEQMTVVQQYHHWTLRAMEPASKRDAPHGMFVDSCWQHCQSSEWNSGPTIGGRNMAKVFGDWYFDRVPLKESKAIMCPYPCKDAGSSC